MSAQHDPGTVSESTEFHSAEEALVAARRDKAAKVRARGANPFANDQTTSSRQTIATLRARCESALQGEPSDLRYNVERVSALGIEPLVLFGRLMARRGFGKAVFLRLRDGSGELQLFAKKDVLGTDFERLEELDVADFVEASGTPMVTRTGELSLELKGLRLLTKAMRPLPDKWHGLTDVDLRYRRRYVDMVANPEVATVMQARSLIVQGLRRYLDGEDFLEVETPTLHSLVGGAAAKPFETHHNALDLELFLRIAPELYLKRLLVGGLERVYEIGRCYRNEGLSTRHNPEFTMLEFYCAYATHDTLMDMAEALFRQVDEHLAAGLGRRGLTSVYAGWVAGRQFSLSEPFVRLPMRQAVANALSKAELPVELAERLAEFAAPDEGAPDVAAPSIKQWATTSARSRAFDWGNLRRALRHCDSDGERLFIAYEYFAEPFLAQDYRSSDGSKSLPVFITEYPCEVSPLARRQDKNAALVDRFELFVEGREICNAFSELNDPDDQAERFREQVRKKSGGAEETMDYDEDYVRALEHGMPPAAGFGLGVDRFTMMLTGQPSIRDVIAFPLLRPEVSER